MLKWQIGDVTVTQIVELTTASLGPHLLPQATPDEMRAIPWMTPFVDDNAKLILSMHSLIIESSGQTIMVDTCIGNDKERAYPRWNKMQGHAAKNSKRRSQSKASRRSRTRRGCNGCGQSLVRSTLLVLRFCVYAAQLRRNK